MSEACNKNCESCKKECGDRQTTKTSFLIAPNEYSRIKKVYAVVSGKGGVGKSMVTSMMANAVQKSGKQAAVLDADITGPSIPRNFGISGHPMQTEAGIIAKSSRGGVKVMSTNLMLENETDPVVWRGPIISSMVKQFYSEVIWDEVDCMFVDMPPGTGDVALTVFQSLPIDGIILVTSPQELVSMIVEKAVKMSEMMDIPTLAIVENMSYFECPDCHRKHQIYGESHVEELAEQYGIEHVLKVPIDINIAKACDHGDIESMDMDIWQELLTLL